MNILHEFFNSKSDANKYLTAEQQESLENDFNEWALTTPSKVQWISVKDRLPEIIGDFENRGGSVYCPVSEKVLCISSFGTMDVSFRKRNTDGEEEWWGMGEGVTYWRLLPPPPKK